MGDASGAGCGVRRSVAQRLGLQGELSWQDGSGMLMLTDRRLPSVFTDLRWGLLRCRAWAAPDRRSPAVALSFLTPCCGRETQYSTRDQLRHCARCDHSYPRPVEDLVYLRGRAPWMSDHSLNHAPLKVARLEEWLALAGGDPLEAALQAQQWRELGALLLASAAHSGLPHPGLESRLP